MAVRLRLRREGTKKKPHFRIVAADHRSPRDGRFIEIIGDYHPMQNPSLVNINEDRALHWLKVGALPSSQVENLLRIAGIWEKFRPGDTARPEHPAEAPTTKEQPAPAAKQQEPKDEAPPEEPEDEVPAEQTAPGEEAGETAEATEQAESTAGDDEPEAAGDEAADESDTSAEGVDDADAGEDTEDDK